MNKKLGILLLVNIPLCTCLYLLFCYIAVRSGYVASHGYGLIVWQIFLFFFILNLVFNLIILFLIKLLNTKPILLITTETFIFYVFLLIWLGS